jgi:uncharacterized protein YecE (DUF72 family)
MQFGRIEHFAEVAFSLPADFPGAALALPAPCVLHASRTHIGLPVWGKKAFVGPLYPEKTKPADYLKAYGQIFSLIELNATHYRVPEVQKIEAWCNDVPGHFLFCPKIPQSISHSKVPQVAELRAFAERIAHFGARLGPCFMQFPDYADVSWKRTVFELTRAFPHRLALELRHPDWFRDPHTGSASTALTSYLASKGIGFVLTDTPGRRDVLHMARTAPFAFVRFLGNSLHPTDFTRISDWATRLQRWGRESQLETFFFLHQPAELDCMPLYRALRAQVDLAT